MGTIDIREYYDLPRLPGIACVPSDFYYVMMELTVDGYDWVRQRR